MDEDLGPIWASAYIEMRFALALMMRKHTCMFRGSWML